MSEAVALAWFGAAISLISGVLTTLKSVTAWTVERKEERKQERLRLRQEALFDALEVVDHVYGNTDFGNGMPAAPHTWDISLVWRASNRMMLYCADPGKTVSAFYAAIGVHNPVAGRPTPRYGPAQLMAFRRVVARSWAFLARRSTIRT